ncbi:MAG: sensor histidine kinase [Kofleriaceae bacterium]
MKREVPVRRRPRLVMVWVAAIVFAVFGLVCAGTTLWEMRTHGHSGLRIVAYCLVVWSAGWAALTPIVAWLGRRAPVIPFSGRALALHFGAALVLSWVHHVWWTAMQVAIKPYDGMGIQRFADGLTKDLIDRGFLEGAIYFAVLGVTYAVDYQRKLREREVMQAKLEASLSQAKLTALELQLQPHFLFNTLHAIGGLVRQDRKTEAVEMINGLGDLLRYSLDNAGKPTVPLDQELAIAERYLDIQRARFSDRMTVTIDATPAARRLHLPAMLLQPLLENAVRHGIERATGPGTISVTARDVDGRLALDVFNTGELGEIEAGIGIANTRARLQQLYGAHHEMELRGEPDGVVASLVIPNKAA